MAASCNVAVQLSRCKYIHWDRQYILTEEVSGVKSSGGVRRGVIVWLSRDMGSMGSL